MDDLSDDVLARWLENPYYRLFCGEEFFCHLAPFDRSSMTRWRQRMGEERLTTLLQESLATATRTGAAKPSGFSQAIVDTTVQPQKSCSSSAPAPTKPRSRTSSIDERGAQRRKDGAPDRLLLAAQVAFKKLVPSNVAGVHAGKGVVHQQLGVDLTYASSHGDGSKCLPKLISPSAGHRSCETAAL
jgi:hypothetical protein